MPTSPNIADSAGQPWAGRHFEPNPSADDDGSAPPQLIAELSRFREGTGDVRDVVRVFRESRLLIPLLSVLGEAGLSPDGRVIDKSQELSIVTVEAPDGRTVLPVFSSVATMNSWNPVARPVPATGERVALAAVSENTELVILDPTSETEFAVRRPALWAIAQERAWTPGFEEPEVLEEFARSIVGEDAVVEVTLSSGDPSARLHGPEVTIHLVIEPGLAESELEKLIARLTAFWSRSELIAERIDSIGVALHSER